MPAFPIADAVHSNITEVYSMDNILSTSCLTKVYGKHRAADSISMNIRQGEIYGLIGRNGAGKTTLMRMISGLSTPTGGDFSLFGKTGVERTAVMERIGALIEAPGIYPNLSAKDNLKVKAIALGLREEAGYEERLLELVGLKDVGRKKARKFSLGMKQRLGIALALVGSPDFLILDEPINGLDPQGIAAIRELIVKLNHDMGVTFLISSHILGELSKIATCFGFMNEGKLIEEITREELEAKCAECIELRTDDPPKAATTLEGMGFGFTVKEGGLIVIDGSSDKSAQIALAMANANVNILSIETRSDDLENYYLKLTESKKGENKNV